MIKKNINVLAAVALIATGAIVAGACSDSDYDFDEIDSTVGIGGELTIPEAPPTQSDWKTCSTSTTATA